MTDDKKALATQPQAGGVTSAFSGDQAFAQAQAQAELLSKSDLVPLSYQKKPANCLVAIEMARRTGASPLAVMQNLYMVHGRPGWSAQWVIGAINASGRFKGSLKFHVAKDGVVKSNGIPNMTCYAYAIGKDGESVQGPTVSMEMATAEGWYGKNPKWKNMPELMLQYRAATFFGRLHVPDLLLGMQSDDELRDVSAPVETESQAANDINARIRRAEPEVVVEDEPTPIGERGEGFL